LAKYLPKWLWCEWFTSQAAGPRLIAGVVPAVQVGKMK